MICELCNSNDILYSYYKRSVNDINFILSKCLKCDLTFKSSPDSTSIDLLSGEYYKLKDIGNIVDSRFIRHFTKRAESHYKYINSYYNGQKKNALDIGCGAGFFIKKLILNGWEAKGVESDPLMFDYGVKSGLNIKNILFEDYQVKEKYGLIYLSHVFDDLPNINKILIKINSMLEENGLLFIEIPNYEWKYKFKKIKYEDLSAGNYFFTRKSLSNVLSMHKFTLLNSYTFEPIHLNSLAQIVSSPFRLYLKLLPPRMKSYLRAIFIKNDN